MYVDTGEYPSPTRRTMNAECCSINMTHFISHECPLVDAPSTTVTITRIYDMVCFQIRLKLQTYKLLKSRQVQEGNTMLNNTN